MSGASITVDGVTYRGEHSVRQDGSRVWIDGKEVGVEVDVNGNRMHRVGEFVECAPCAAKSGAPTLCTSCLFNRETISMLQQRLRLRRPWWRRWFR